MEQTGDLEELRALLWKAARKGNVPAMRILMTELKGDGQDSAETPSVIDELASKRSKTAAIR
jgi:hypothetical protein